MTISRNAVRALGGSALLLIMAWGAHAQDATAVADRLKEALAGQSIDISWTDISGDASEMVLKGVSVKPVGEAEPLPIGDITLTGVSEEAGAYKIETLTTQPFSKTKDGIALDVSSLVVNGMNIPAPGNTDVLAGLMLYESLELASLTVQVAEKTAFAMQGLAFEMTPPEAGKAMEFSGAAEKFSADLSLVEDPQSRAVIEALGYQNIEGYMELAGSWQPADGRLSLSQYDIAIDDAGTLGMTFDFGGYTLDFIKSMQEMSRKMAEQPAGADNSAQGMAMLGLMQQLSIGGASIRFDDDSLTGKVLDFFGKQQGMSGKDVANQAKAIVPFLMSQMNNPELTQQVTAAVSAFLDSPENIEIAAEPAAAVPFAVIMAGAMSNPLDLPKTLGVAVRANQ
ncbi:MAG: hypothetical protein ABTQ31_10800 [Rhizobiaceae bacterium]